MKKNIIINKIFISFVISMIIFIVPVSSYNENFNNNYEEPVTIRICINSNDINTNYLDIPYYQTQRIIKKISDLKFLLNNNQIDEMSYIEKFIEIFRIENILPEEFDIGKLFENFDLAYDEKTFFPINNLIKINHYDLYKNNVLHNIPIHIGRRTIIASIGIGNYLVNRIIPIKPYGFIDIFNKEILKKFNLTSTFSYAAACIWTPGPSGFHVLHSYIPINGYETLSHKIFYNKSIGGIFILGLNISLEAFSKDNEKVYFDATIGIYGADLMIGF